METITKNETGTKEKKKRQINISPKARKIIFTMFAVISVAVFAFSMTPKTLQNDTFYTVKVGEWISNNGISDLTQDYFSWLDLPYSYPHWLYDFLMYTLYSIGGWDAIYYSTVVLSVILALSIFFISNKLSKNTFASFIVTMGAMYVIRPFIAARAQLLTFILFAWTVFLIEEFLKEKQDNRIRVLCGILLVLIPFLITNLHCAVFPFYFVLFLPYIGEYIVAVVADWDLDKRLMLLFIKFLGLFKNKASKIEKNKKMQEKVKEQIKHSQERRVKLRANPYKLKVTKNHMVLFLLFIMAMAVLTGFLNPAGTGAFTYVQKTMQGNTTTQINEHLPLELINNREFSITLVIFLMVLILTDTKIKLSDFFMIAGLGYLSFKMRRQVSMFAIFGAFVLAKLIAGFMEKYAKDTTQKIYKFFTMPIGILLLITIVAQVSMKLYGPINREQYIYNSSYPIKACDWIQENLDLEYVKFYNEYNFGAYMLYRDIPVFIDSRCDLYTPQFNSDYESDVKGKDIFSDALNIAGYSLDYNAKFEEYGVTHIISYSNSRLCLALENDSRYRRIFEDDYFRIYAKIDQERDIEKQIPSLNKGEKTPGEEVFLKGEIVEGNITYEENNL